MSIGAPSDIWFIGPPGINYRLSNKYRGTDFTDSYERIIHRMKRSLEPMQWIIACKLLGWMVCAKRPLKWREIQAAVSINPANQSIEFKERKLRSDIQDYCGALIQVLSGDRVELVHSTAKM